MVLKTERSVGSWALCPAYQTRVFPPSPSVHEHPENRARTEQDNFVFDISSPKLYFSSQRSPSPSSLERSFIFYTPSPPAICYQKALCAAGFWSTRPFYVNILTHQEYLNVFSLFLLQSPSLQESLIFLFFRVCFFSHQLVVALCGPSRPPSYTSFPPFREKGITFLLQR